MFGRARPPGAPKGSSHLVTTENRACRSSKSVRWLPGFAYNERIAMKLQDTSCSEHAVSFPGIVQSKPA
jgi:hypothetical protein